MTDSMDQKNVLAQALSVGLPVKENILKAQNRLKVLDSEITCLARQIKCWMLIASRNKEKAISTNCEDFFAWEQHSSLSRIAIDGLKIADDAKKWSKSAIDILEVGKIKTTALIRNSRMQDGLTKLQQIVAPLRELRNKRFAHLDPTELEKKMESVICDLEILYAALADLRSSLCYIEHFIINPQHILSEQWDCYRNDTNSNHHRAALDRYFQIDPSIMSLEEVLDACSKKMSMFINDSKLFDGEFQNKVQI